MSYLCKNCGERFDMPIMLTSYPPKDGCPKCISTKIVRVGDAAQQQNDNGNFIAHAPTDGNK